MEFVEPSRLAWLALLPLLYLLSRPPRPKRTELTAHLAQWLEAQRKLKRPRVRFRWLRFLLLVLAFAAVVVAHSELELKGSAGAEELVVLVDRSASMGARRPGQPSALERAQKEFAALLDRVPAHVDVRLGLCDTELEVVRGTRDQLREIVRGLAPSARPGDLDLDAVAGSLTTDATAVLTLTDGLGPTRAPGHGALRLVGEPLPNAGITACELVDAWPLPELELTVRVQNGITTGPERTFVVACEGAIESPVRLKLTVPAGRAKTLRHALRRGRGGVLRVRLEQSGPGPALAAHTDALAMDDRVELDVPPAPQPTVLVRSEGLVSRALRAGAETIAGEFGGTVQVGGDAERAGFVLYAGGAIERVAPGVRMLSFGTALGPGDPARATAPSVIDWDREHPITRGLDLSDLTIGSALRWLDGMSGQVLIRGSAGPLAVLRRTGSGAAVHLAFRLEDSNFDRLAAFPQFLRRCVAASYGDAAVPRLRQGLLSAAESNLSPGGGRLAERQLPAFSRPSRGLAVPLLVLALLCLAARIYA